MQLRSVGIVALEEMTRLIDAIRTEYIQADTKRGFIFLGGKLSVSFRITLRKLASNQRQPCQELLTST